MKKILSFLLILIIVFALGACGCEEGEEVASENVVNNVEKAEILLYFADKDANLAIERRAVVLESFEKSVVEELIKGPVNKDLSKTINGDVKVVSSIVKDGICTIELSKEFEKYNTSGSAGESIAIYSIVNTLCEAEHINKVQIKIEGKAIGEYTGHVYIDEPLEADPNMVRIQDR